MIKKWEYTDKFGNKIIAESEKKDKEIIVKRTYILEDGRSTPRGEYPKLKETGCADPARMSCNYGDGFERCQYMKYIVCGWKCTAN